jgi:type II secretory pathway pseudopilin PulG
MCLATGSDAGPDGHQSATTRGYGAAGSARPPVVVSRWEGHTLIEMLFTLGLISVFAALAIPSALASVDRARATSAARYLTSRMAMARSHAVMRAAVVALRFDEGAAGVTFQMFVDGNRNGVRTRDIASRVDQPLDAPVRLSDLFPGVAIAASGDEGSDPLRIGSSNLLSFTPLGTATSGSVYVRGADGTQFAIRILGTTGRVRVQRYRAVSRTWVDGF